MNKYYENNKNKDYNLGDSQNKTAKKNSFSCCGCICGLIPLSLVLIVFFICFFSFVWTEILDVAQKEYIITTFVEKIFGKPNNIQKKEKEEKKNNILTVKKEPIKLDENKQKVKEKTSDKYCNPSEDKEWEETYNLIKKGELVKLFNYTKKTEKDLSKMYYKGVPAIFTAIEYEKYDIVKFLLNSFDCKKIVDKQKQQNALHYAAIKGDTTAIELLLQNGFDINSTDSDGNTPLYFAIIHPFPDCLKLLLDKGAKPNTQNSKGVTPLHFATKKSNTFAMELLMKAGANPNLPDLSGNTPMHYISLYSRDYKTLDSIYDYWDKLDLNAKNKDGKTPRNIISWDYFDYYKNNFRKKFRY